MYMHPYLAGTSLGGHPSPPPLHLFSQLPASIGGSVCQVQHQYESQGARRMSSHPALSCATHQSLGERRSSIAVTASALVGKASPRGETRSHTGLDSLATASRLRSANVSCPRGRATAS